MSLASLASTFITTNDARKLGVNTHLCTIGSTQNALLEALLEMHYGTDELPGNSTRYTDQLICVAIVLNRYSQCCEVYSLNDKAHNHFVVASQPMASCSK